MSELVKVTGNSDGDVIVKSSNNEAYAYIRVEQERVVFDEVTGFVKVKKVSALVPGLVEDLKRLNWSNGKVIQGKIVIREQLLPFNKVNPEKHLKVAGDTGVVCTKDGQDIFRNTYYTPNPAAQDLLIQHTNSDQIKLAQAQLTEDVESDDLTL